LAESGLILEKLNKDRAGVYIGSGAGGLTTLRDNYKTMLEKGSKRVSPFMLPASISNMESGLTAIKTCFRGPSFSPASSCVTSNHAFGVDYLIIACVYYDLIQY